ncbi:MAG: ankyrin repeat domain-containing protein, partial [Pseudomonadota bacterium]|nr:ankyrin repeat domain-containing protein [Pseudomonadota bacterium]
TQNSELQDAVLKEIKNYGIAWEDKLRMAIEYDFDVLIDQSMQIDIEIHTITDKLKQLLDAVLQSNQVRVMKLLMDKAISLEIKDTNDRSMLHYIVMMRELCIIPKAESAPYLQNLITKKDSLGISPLELAIEANNEHAVIWMLKKCKKTTVDYTMIVRAIKNFSAASVVFKMIANNPALVNMKNRKNRKPLTHIAISDGRMDILNYLLEQGCDWRKRDAEGKSMIDFSIECEQYDILGYLLCLIYKQGYESPDTDKWVRNAINNDKPSILDAVFTNIPEYINSSLQKNTTLLIHAIKVNASFAVIRSMVKNGAKVNTVNNDNQTPLHLSVMSGRADLVKLLLNNGAVTNKQDTCIAKKYQPIITDIPNGLFSKEKKKEKALVALHYAALEMSMKSADEIINVERTRYGKVDSLYKETELGLTPLHYAIMKNDKDMVSRMLDEMDINKIAQFTVSVINTAVCYRNYDILYCILGLPNASILLQEKRKVRGVIERTKKQGQETKPVVEYLNRIYYTYTEGDQNIIEKCSNSAVQDRQKYINKI